MRNASDVKESFAKRKQSYNTVFLKESAVFQQGVLDEMDVFMLWMTRYSRGYLFSTGMLLPT